MTRRMTEMTSDTSSDAPQPSRLEKKKNMGNWQRPHPTGGTVGGAGLLVAELRDVPL